MGAQGRLVEVYDNTIVMIDTFLAKVTYVAPAAYDAQGHLRTGLPSSSMSMPPRDPLLLPRSPSPTARMRIRMLSAITFS